jgi:two-component system osmolarity sensor histidine kinase EnvZ
MLAGVSHDLKTPLTRLKLQLAMMPADPETAAMREDVAHMEHMLDEYLEFARGEGGEKSSSIDLSKLVGDIAAAAGRGKVAGAIGTGIEAGVTLAVKPNALRRCLNNLIDNALKHGKRVTVTLRRAEDGGLAEILVDDDGPGIAEAKRNLQAGGSGLGLAIARDIARAHGGDLVLADSPLGGLRAVVRLPV